MAELPPSPQITVEIVRRGRQLMGEPYFAPGVPIPLDLKGFGGLGPGDLALIRSGRGRARIERALGSAKRIESVLEGLLCEQGARVEFEQFELPQPSVEGRVDLRDLIAITIDPDTAKDFDDALSFRREGDGIRAFVHIADVSYFVPAGAPLDHGAAQRALSTYVPGLVAPMLPHELADDACSLRPHQDRLCLTVEMPPSGEPLFYRSVIRSRARLTYGQAERREGSPEVVEQLELAAELAHALRKRRFERGALELSTLELGFTFEDGRVVAARREGERDAHMLVEELMICANEHVAAFLAGRGREALYRVHERPEPRSITLLVEKLAALGVPTPPLPETLSPQAAAPLAGAVSRSVTDYVKRSGRGAEAFPSLVLRALKQARYDPRNLGHSGLASRAYCHFTSPIRRYPDLVVHRALLAELGLTSDVLPGDLAGLAEHVSAREREAASLEYLADDICLAWLLEDTLLGRGWEEPFDGEITGMIGSGLFVRFGEVFEGYLPARRLPGEFFELNRTGTALAGRRSGRSYSLGDPISVQVETISRGEGRVELGLSGARRAGSASLSRARR
jgi:ribonuclease R